MQTPTDGNGNRHEMARARSFASLIALLKRAERALAGGGITDAEQQLMALRGLYYGTAWSHDFRAERSQIRNIGFTVFTGFGRPVDPRPALGTRLAADLQASQDINDRGRLVDVGHMLIGMEARTSTAARSVTIPTQGGTGLEIVTWLGDLGGGAANLAWRRSAGGSAARRSVSHVFSNRGSDYGAAINLEGDVAGYLAGSAAGDDLGSSSLSGGVADAVESYLPRATGHSPRYDARAEDFLRIMGAEFSGGAMSNRADVVSEMAETIADFAQAYMLQRYILGQGRPRTRVENACKHVVGAAEEIAEVFVAALEGVMTGGASVIRGGRPWPTPKPPAATCEFNGLKLATREREATQLIDEGLRDAREAAEGLLREIGLD